MAYLTTKIVGKDTTLPVAADTVFMSPCLEQYIVDGRKQMYLTAVSIIAHKRLDGAGFDVAELNGVDCSPITYKTAFNAQLLRNVVTRAREYDDRGSNNAATNGYAKNSIQTDRFIARCPANTIITEVGVSAVDPFVPISRMSFRCQDLNSTVYGQQYFDPTIYNEAGQPMPESFFVGMDNVPVIDKLRCNDGDAPIGIYKSKVNGYLNSVAFYCRPFDFPMPSIAAAPPPTGPTPEEIAAAEAAACEKAKADAIAAQAAADAAQAAADAAAQRAATADAQAAAADAAAKAAVADAAARVAEANAAARAAADKAAADKAAADATARAAADAAAKAIADANAKAAAAEAKAATAEAAAKDAAAKATAAEAAAAKAADAEAAAKEAASKTAGTDSGDGNNTIIVGAVLGLMLLGIIIAVVVYFALKKKKEAAALKAAGGGDGK